MIAGDNEHVDNRHAVWPGIFAVLISFCVAALAVGWLARAPSARLALDQPNERSLHSVPVPRTGGIGLLLGIAAGWTILGPALPWSFWCAMALLIAISFFDDYLTRGLPAALRFGAHLIAAAMLALTLPGLNNHMLIALLATLATAWMCNLYNFMDGSDGLAGGMALFGFACFAAAAWFADNPAFALLNLIVAAAAAGFLLHNFHPARIFLGDAGSVPLGFLAAAFGLIGWQKQIWPWWFPLLVFSPFIVDASVTLARRAFAGAAIWRAHRDHYYQRLVQLGWGHRRTALAEYALMAGCGVAALLALQWPPLAQLSLLVVAAVIYALLIAAITRAWHKAQAGTRA